ncbi:PucR family transcriptional regulator [Candidatus Hakubella thermalkaliphila]|nr:helix-turn-helix domain-containing protein [Candidatus Hakubella thermalkaliphila]
MDKVDYLVLEYGATVAALEILKKSKDERALDRLESDFVHDLIFSEDMTEQNAAERALFLKFDPAAPHIIVTIDIDDFSDYLRKSQVSSEVDIQILKQKLFYTAHKKLSDSHLKFVSSRRSDKIVFIIEVGESYDLTPIKDIFEELRDHIARNFQDITVSVGISSSCMSVEHIPKGYGETEKAIKIGRILGGRNKVTCFDELGVYQILFNLKEDEEIKDFIERQIGRLPKLKNNKRNELTHTLNTYIELGGNTSKTAEALFVHRNTLNYRLRTLNNLLKQDLHNPHTLLNLAIALKLLRLQNK